MRFRSYYSQRYSRSDQYGPFNREQVLIQSRELIELHKQEASIVIKFMPLSPPELTPMSALPPKADIAKRISDVRFVPKADKVRRSKITLLDHLVSGDEQSLRHRDAERLGRFEIDEQLEFGRLLDG